jgi:hypothetical protein
VPSTATEPTVEVAYILAFSCNFFSFKLM